MVGGSERGKDEQGLNISLSLSLTVKLPPAMPTIITAVGNVRNSNVFKILGLKLSMLCYLSITANSP